jgi:hypothetical protein
LDLGSHSGHDCFTVEVGGFRWQYLKFWWSFNKILLIVINRWIMSFINCDVSNFEKCVFYTNCSLNIQETASKFYDIQARGKLYTYPSIVSRGMKRTQFAG